MSQSGRDMHVRFNRRIDVDSLSTCLYKSLVLTMAVLDYHIAALCFWTILNDHAFCQPVMIMAMYNGG